MSSQLLPESARHTLPSAVAPSALGGFLALVAAHGCVDIAVGIWPIYKTLAGLDLAMAGLVATVASMSGNAAQFLFGVAADRGWQRIMLVLGVLLAGGSFWLPLVGGWPAMTALLAATFVGSAMFHPAGAGLAGGLSAERKGLFVALFLAGGYVGTAVSQALFSATWTNLGAWAVVLFALPAACAIGLACHVLPQPRRDFPPLAESMMLMRRQLPHLWVMFVVQVSSTITALAVIFLLPDLLLARKAPTWLVAGGGHAVLILGACAALVPSGHLADRLGPRLVLTIANLASGVALAAFLLLPDIHPLWSMLLLATFGFTNAANNPVLVAEGNRLLPGQGAAASALLMGLPWCVAAMTPLIAGVIAAQSGAAAGIGWLALSVPVSVAIGLGLRGHR